MNMNSMPNCPQINGCVCYDASACEECVCPSEEKALRAWSISPSAIDIPVMSPEQREWCLREIDNTEGFRRQDFETVSDALLANGVLSAWVDYCRDKGLL